MELAREANLDLVEVAAQERPPVCKILDYGKLRYEQSRKGGKNKVHQQKLKEIRVRPKTGDHDVDTKVNQARKFLEHNDKVLVNVLFRGRELQHVEEGKRIVDQILEKLADCCKVEKSPSMEGRRMTACSRRRRRKRDRVIFPLHKTPPTPYNTPSPRVALSWGRS